MGSVINIATGEYLGRRGAQPKPEENFDGQGLVWITDNYTGSFLKPVWDFENSVFVEGASLEELEAKKQNRIKEIRERYKSLIDDFARIESQKKIMRDAIGEPYEISRSAKDEYIRLRGLCNDEIAALDSGAEMMKMLPGAMKKR